METTDKRRENPDNANPIDERTDLESGMEGNNKPSENLEESYVKPDQQSDLSYSRNSGHESEPNNDSKK